MDSSEVELLKEFHNTMRKLSLDEVVKRVKQHPFLASAENPRTGHAALNHACTSGNVELAKILLPFVESPDWGRLLAEACIHKHLECAQWVATHVDPKKPGPGGYTPLMHVAFMGNGPLFDWILPLSDVRAVDDDGRTALMHAVLGAEVEAISRLLLESDVQAVDKEGDSALILAAKKGSAQGIELLLPGCAVEAKNLSGKTALDEALTALRLEQRDAKTYGRRLHKEYEVCVEWIARAWPLESLRRHWGLHYSPEAQQRFPHLRAIIEQRSLQEALADSPTTHPKSLQDQTVDPQSPRNIKDMDVISPAAESTRSNSSETKGLRQRRL